MIVSGALWAAAVGTWLTIEVREGTTLRGTVLVKFKPGSINRRRIDLTSIVATFTTPNDPGVIRVRILPSDEKVRLRYAEINAERAAADNSITAQLKQNGAAFASKRASLSRHPGVFRLRLTTSDKNSMSIDGDIAANLSVRLIPASGSGARFRLRRCYWSYGGSGVAATAALTDRLIGDQGAGYVELANVTHNLSAGTFQVRYPLTAADRSNITTLETIRRKIEVAGNAGAVKINRAYIDANKPVVADVPPPNNRWRNTIVPYYPGHYLRVPDAEPVSDVWIDKISGKPDWKGVAWRQKWRDIEVAEGVYDWTPIRAALAALGGYATSPKLALTITAKSGNGVAPTPAYLGGLNTAYVPNSVGDGFTAMLWSPSIDASWRNLWSAFAVEFANDWNKFCLVESHDTTADVSAAIYDGSLYGFSVPAWESKLADFYAFLRTSSSGTPWACRLGSFSSTAALRSLAASCISRSIYLVGPDVAPGGHADTSEYQILRESLSSVPLFSEVQSDDFDAYSPVYQAVPTPDQLIEYVSTHASGIKIQGLIWNPRPPYYPAQVESGVRARGISGNRSFPVAISSQATTSRWRNTPIPYHPGMYISLNPALDLDNPSVFDSLYSNWQNDNNINGFGWRITWRDIEVAEGVYDWTKTDGFLRNIRRVNQRDNRALKMILDITPKSFIGNPPSIPQWVLDQYGGYLSTYVYAGQASAPQPGTQPIFWDNGTASAAAVTTAWLNFWTAFSARYAADWDDFAWVSTNETAAGETAAGFTHARYVTFWTQFFAHVRSVSAGIPVLCRMNYLGGTANGNTQSYDNLSTILTTCIEKNIFLGGPDIHIGVASLNGSSYRIFRELAGKLPIFHDVQWDNYGKRSGQLGRNQTVDDIASYCTGGPISGSMQMQGLLWLDFRGTVDGRDTRTDIKVACATYKDRLTVV